jgi:hypothetical protein
MLKVIIIILITKQLLEKVAQKNVGKSCAKERWKKLRKRTLAKVAQNIKYSQKLMFCKRFRLKSNFWLHLFIKGGK